MGAGVIGTYLGVVAVVLRSWCVVMCTVCQFPTGVVFRMGAGSMAIIPIFKKKNRS